MGVYSISKTALFGLTKALSVELGGENIRVNCLAPGVIKTKLSSAVSALIYIVHTFYCFNEIKGVGKVMYVRRHDKPAHSYIM